MNGFDKLDFQTFSHNPHHVTFEFFYTQLLTWDFSLADFFLQFTMFVCLSTQRHPPSSPVKGNNAGAARTTDSLLSSVQQFVGINNNKLWAD